MRTTRFTKTGFLVRPSLLGRAAIATAPRDFSPIEINAIPCRHEPLSISLPPRFPQNFFAHQRRGNRPRFFLPTAAGGGRAPGITRAGRSSFLDRPTDALGAAHTRRG